LGLFNTDGERCRCFFPNEASHAKPADSIERRLVHAEILLGELSSGFWHITLNNEDAEGRMGEKVLEYWKTWNDATHMEDAEEASPAPLAPMDENLLVYAMRYALGRQTGATAQVASAIILNWPRLSEQTKAQILKEVRNEARFPEEWESVLALDFGKE
jgi:hypothetical protein